MSNNVIDIFPDFDAKPATQAGPPAKVPPVRPHIRFPRFPNRGAWGWMDERTLAKALANLAAQDPKRAEEVTAYLAATDEDPADFFLQRGPLNPADSIEGTGADIPSLEEQTAAWHQQPRGAVVWAGAMAEKMAA